MAERTSLKFADREPVSDEDPFAELTRIMGFDPRQPVGRQEAADPVMGDDFDIDLEKELMGEFGFDEEGESAAAAPPSEPAVSQAESLDLDVAPAREEGHADIAPDFDFAPDFDIAIEDEASLAPEVEFDRDFDDALTQSFGTETPETGTFGTEEAAPAVEAAVTEEFDAHFDDAMAEVDMDFDLPAEPEVHAGAEASDPFGEAFSLDMGDAEPDARPEVAAAPVIEPVAAPSPERSLEDELNALLGNMGASIARPQDMPAGPPVWTSAASAAPATDPFSVAAAGYGFAPEAGASYSSAHADAAASQESTADAAQEIDFDPADIEAFAVEPEPEPEAAPAPVTSIFSRSWNRATPVSPAATPAVEEPPVPVEEPLFSASAFEAELEQELADEPQALAEPEDQPAAAAYEEAPDVETVDVPERVVALADDLDLPELIFEEERPSSSFDDLDAEFAGLINDMNEAPAAPEPARRASYEDEPYQAGFKPAAWHGAAGTEALPHAVPAAAGEAAAVQDDLDLMDVDARPFAPAESFDADPLDYDPEFEEAMAMPDPAIAASAAQPRRRGLIAAAAVAAVAVIGGIGAFALSPGGGDSGAPVLVKADDAPIKVKPENPGGTVVPNQDNKVYEAVAKGIQPAAPEQQQLVVDEQQPVNVNTAAPQNRVVDLSPDEDAGDDVAAPLAKSEDRIDPAAQQAAAGDADQDVALVTPRKVRTMIVKPDGTLAPREEVAPAADVAAAEPADPEPQRVVSAGAQGQEQTGTVPAAADTDVDAVAEAATEVPAAPKAKAAAQSPTTPQTVAAAPQRPSDQPVDVVGEVKPDQVASISPAAAAAGSWSMQIASQPSAEAAQSTYNDLARRYASVLQGQPVNIVKAEIAGKGTFYRVRVPANSRNDAIKLCESYKAAGGNCFVSK